MVLLNFTTYSAFAMIKELLVNTLSQTVMITVFVLFMMVVIEYINIQSKNMLSEKLRGSPMAQIISGALLGITPGCMGAFAVVSLYTHRMISIPALVATMIATSGDEAFVMFALFPGKALILHAVLFVIAILAGWLVQLFTGGKPFPDQYGFAIHNQDVCKCFDKEVILPQLKKISFERAVMVLFALVISLLLLADIIGPKEWNWKKTTFISGSVFLLFAFLTVPEHFLKEHFYNHILKKHLLRIFLWTWGAFIFLHFATANIALNNLIQNNIYVILLIAVLIGIIPESGPHLVFVTLFSQGLLPFSNLLTNSIVQDGHGMLPLLAESQKDFVKVKVINMLVGLLAGLSLLLAGY